MKLLPTIAGILIAVTLAGVVIRLSRPSPITVAPQAMPVPTQRLFTTPVGLGDSEMRCYQITLPAGWIIESQQSHAPQDEAAARDGLAELHLRRTTRLQETVIVEIAEECRVHPHQGLALAFDDQGHHVNTHILLKQSWTTKHGVEGEVLKQFLPNGHLIGYKIVTPTCEIGYLDVHCNPESPQQLSPTALQALARQLFGSLRLLTPDGKEVKD